jgi:hypothetical protein
MARQVTVVSTMGGEGELHVFASEAKAREVAAANAPYGLMYGNRTVLGDDTNAGAVGTTVHAVEQWDCGCCFGVTAVVADESIATKMAAKLPDSYVSTYTVE